MLCALTFPHSFLRADGVEVHGVRTVGLCPVCDAENPAGRAVVSHFSNHGEVTSAHVDDVATLLREWSEEVVRSDVTAADVTAAL
ncbi:DUF6300 family protein [Nocardia sp. NPDC004604]|uniref:DUF6300 family protein n=1 Tax=Nocardia sp. NPDC004604 TaxID=3157013 RepID=UPI00339FCF2E